MHPESNAILTAYQEVSKSHGAILEFRTKLLGFLPLASGVGGVVPPAVELG